MIKQYLLLIWKGIKYRKLRTALTVLGIVIGIAAIVALMLVSNGLENSIKEQFNKIGTNRMYVMMKSGGGLSIGTGLTDDDVKVVEALPYFKWVTPYLIQNLPGEYGRKVKTLYIIGIPPDNLGGRWADIDLGVSQGRLFQASDKYVIIIGIKVANDIFDRKVNLNSNLLIDGKPFKVIGIFKEIGNPQDDSQVYLPLDTSREFKGADNKDVSMIELVVRPGVNMDEAREQVIKKLAKHRGFKIGDEDFDVQTPEQLLAQLNTVLAIIQTVLAAIAVISLVVGTIGIMNSMYTSVLERTMDIGVMRAVGATEKSILTIFLIESTLVGLFGGAIGVIIGVSISKLFEYIAAAAGYSIFKVAIQPFWVIFGFVFSGFIGFIAGYLPAKRASELTPVEALR